MRTFSLLTIGLILSYSVVAQVPALPAPQPLHPERLLLKLAPLTLFDPSTSALMLGLEFRPVPRVGIEVDYGFRFRPLQLFSWNQNKENLRYQKFKLEGRYYIPRSERTQWYVAAEAFYVPQQYDLQRGTYERGDERRAYDRAHIEREVRGAALKAGQIRRLGQRFWLDMALGLGVRMREVRYQTQNERTADPLFDAPNQNFLATTPNPGRRTRLAPAAALRLGYTLLK
jgi:Protein of unknown function (DUF3575)